MKTILLPFHDEEAGRTAVEAAAFIVQRYDGFLQGLLVQEGPHVSFGRNMPVPAEYLAQAVRQWREFAASAREHFFALTRDRGMVPGEIESAGAGPMAAWREVEGRESQVVGEYGRLFDLIVVGRSGEQAAVRWEETCEAALFETGRPILLAARRSRMALGEHIIIAWNGSTETARTVALASPLLTAASSVTVLTVEGGMVPGPSGAELAAHLRRTGVAADGLRVSAEGRTVGEAILETCEERGADLLVKGAYTRSRLRQIVFGGATEHVMRWARLPVFLAH
ncbi:MAG: universal stress protein [Rhodospirillales bacterium]|nr:universal stress protein [Rhodospirillales bacterium]